MRKFFVMMAVIVSTDSYAEVYKCVDKKGHVHFQDQVCSYENGKLAAYQPSGQYQARNPVEVQNEITTLQNQANSRRYSGYRYRYESNELIDSKRRKEADSQQRWDSLGRAGVTYRNSPSTYYQTRFAQR